MKVVYLGHSGFLAESDRAYYLFDYIRGELPDFTGEKPLYVFASHAHDDHFRKEIFEKILGTETFRYVLGRDINRRLRRKKGILPPGVEKKIVWAGPGEEICFPDCRVYPLKSTDYGVAFVVREPDGTQIYHAGDLNWWHWEGEPDDWNRNMEVNYKREIDRIKGQQFKAAFVPLDPRQENAYWLGMDYFLKNVEAEHVFPMHFWKDYEVIKRFQNEHGEYPCIEMIEREGQKYEI